MKKLLPILLLIAATSCGGKESKSSEQENILENLTYSVDTIVMDPGEDLFNLSMGIRDLDLTEDKRQLFYFENMPPKLLQVDLDNLSLLSKTEFEQEGPDAVGRFVANIQVGPNNQIYAVGLSELGIYNLSGEKIQNLKIQPEGIDPELAKNSNALFLNSIYDFVNQQIYTWVNHETSSTNSLFQIDVASESAVLIEAPEMDIVQQYSLLAEDNGSYMASPQNVHLLKHKGKILIHCSAMANLYEFDPKDGSIKYIEINHQLVPNRLTGEVNRELKSEADFRKEMKKINEQINYLKIEWDPSRQMYLRLAMKSFLGETRSDPISYEYYIFAYDQDFNLLGESKLDLEERLDYSFFFKDGKLYSYVNVDDELGFAVFTFDF
ncbi:DUF4221 family protein [Algoriphagus chordae]|uniref:Uncharacterized protein DUF4221 n=1 Tax=Algoriphagus chordae TaxID=237019 RepID=A0A2W7QEP5_9BACT|nr:DUF4221 family protein [Algoriphagus chordae]PZX47008.1 uncharacterized protein DUF4221 [Algoriphagus chordae]